jgi:hypothetical protein
LCHLIARRNIISGINEIHKVRKDITLVDHPKYYGSSLSSAASKYRATHHGMPSEKSAGGGQTFSHK